MTPQRTVHQLADWDRLYLWHPFTQMKEWAQTEPLIIERGQGVYVTDLHGHSYLDGVSSLWVNIHGHRHPHLDRAIRQQLKKIAHSTLLGLSNVPAILLARALVALAPPGLTKVFFSDNGSTAMEVALKIAVQYWKHSGASSHSKDRFIHLGLAYHGDTVGDMSVSGMEQFHAPFRNLLFPSYAIDPPYCYRCPLRLTFPSCRLACLQPLERLLSDHHQEIAGMVIEPMVQAVAGMVTAPPGYLRRIRELCTQFNVLLIADEVATGFGRTGRMFACEHESVTPDLMAVAKGLTGGYLPLAATLVTDKIYEAFLGEYQEWKTFFHGHSYTGNPLGCAVALANLEIFKKSRTLSNIQRRSLLLHTLLQPLRQERIVGDIRQCGFMVGIELVQNQSTRRPFPLAQRMGHQVALAAREDGLLIRPIGNVVILMPPLITTAKELRAMVRILRQAIRAVATSSKNRSAKLNHSAELNA